MKNAEREFTAAALELDPIAIPARMDEASLAATGKHDFPTLEMPAPALAKAPARAAERPNLLDAGEMDLRGLRPPFALLRALPLLKRLNPGGQLRIAVDDQSVLRDFIDLCTIQGHALKTVAENDSGLHFTLTRR